MIASLPMYDWPEMRAAHEAFWTILAREFRRAGFDAPDQLDHDGEHDDHWLHPDLLFSQTCGYPYANRLSKKVSLLATPCFDVEGCKGPYYSSAIIVRADAKYATLQDALSGCLAYNSMDSLSGYRCFSPLVEDAKIAFSTSMISGSHRQSALKVAAGEADCAAIDAVCWDMFQRFEPDASSRLRVLQWGPTFPALPFITRKDWSRSQLDGLQSAVVLATDTASSEPGCADLKIAGSAFIDEEAYGLLKNLT